MQTISVLFFHLCSVSLCDNVGPKRNAKIKYEFLLSFYFSCHTEMSARKKKPSPPPYYDITYCVNGKCKMMVNHCNPSPKNANKLYYRNLSTTSAHSIPSDCDACDICEPLFCVCVPQCNVVRTNCRFYAFTTALACARNSISYFSGNWFRTFSDVQFA